MKAPGLAQETPKAVFEKTIVDFGKVKPSTTVYELIRVDDQGPGVLTISARPEESSAAFLQAAAFRKGGADSKVWMVQVALTVLPDAAGALEEFVRFATNAEGLESVKITVKAHVDAPVVDRESWVYYYAKQDGDYEEISKKIEAVRSAKGAPTLVKQRDQGPPENWEMFKRHRALLGIPEQGTVPHALFFKDRFYLRKAEILAALTALAEDKEPPASTPLANQQQAPPPQAQGQAQPSFEVLLYLDPKEKDHQAFLQQLRNELIKALGDDLSRSARFNVMDKSNADAQTGFCRLLTGNQPSLTRLTPEQRTEVEAGRIPAQWTCAAIFGLGAKMRWAAGNYQSVANEVLAAAQQRRGEVAGTMASPNFRNQLTQVPGAPVAATAKKAAAKKDDAEGDNLALYWVIALGVLLVGGLVVYQWYSDKQNAPSPFEPEAPRSHSSPPPMS